MLRKLAVTGIMMSATIAHAGVHKTSWGSVDGKPVDLYTISTPRITVSVTNYGAHVVSVLAPDRRGQRANVVLGYKDLAGYQADSKTYMGAIVGRFGNRIAKGTFSLSGETFHVPINNAPNALHGGPEGFDRKVWTATELPNGVELTLVSPDGDMGFPGALTAQVRYTVKDSSLHIDYSASTTKPTVINLTNHSYFNLAGEASGSILEQELTLNADKFTPVDAGLIPTGELRAVTGTPFDFRKATAIGTRISAADEQLKLAGGYDHNWVLNGTGMREAVRVLDPKSGRTLTVTTNEPGIQFYSGNFLDGAFTGVGGVPYQKHAGFCLETQHFPDSPNEPSFPSTELKPGYPMHSSTVFTFGAQK